LWSVDVEGAVYGHDVVVAGELEGREEAEGCGGVDGSVWGTVWAAGDDAEVTGGGLFEAGVDVRGEAKGRGGLEEAEEIVEGDDWFA